MQIDIEIIDVTVTQPTGKKYKMAEVSYRDLKQGKVNAKKIMDFAAKEVFGVVKDAVKGDKFSVELIKNADSGYWDWTSISRAGEQGNSGGASKPSQAGGSSGGSRGNYVDDAKKQVMIIRQSSISSAVNLLRGTDGVSDADTVIATAKKFENYVLGFDQEVGEEVAVPAKATKPAKAATALPDFEDEEDSIPF